MLREKDNMHEAAERAAIKQADPKVRAWMKRARRLFKDQPPETWIYWQEATMHLMALGPNGERYINGYNHGGGSDQSAIVDRINVPGSDAGAW